MTSFLGRWFAPRWKSRSTSHCGSSYSSFCQHSARFAESFFADYRKEPCDATAQFANDSLIVVVGGDVGFFCCVPPPDEPRPGALGKLLAAQSPPTSSPR